MDGERAAEIPNLTNSYKHHKHDNVLFSCDSNYSIISLLQVRHSEEVENVRKVSNLRSKGRLSG